MPGVRDRNRRTHIGVFTGEEFRLRKISVSEFIEFFGALPAEQSDTLVKQLQAIGEKSDAKVAESAEGAMEMRQFWLEHGVVSPKIFFGPYDECPEDQLHVDDMSDDANTLVGIIQEFSYDFLNYKKKIQEVLLRQQSDLTGLGGEEIREAANGGPPAGNG